MRLALALAESRHMIMTIATKMAVTMPMVVPMSMPCDDEAYVRARGPRLARDTAGAICPGVLGRRSVPSKMMVAKCLCSRLKWVIRLPDSIEDCYRGEHAGLIGG